MTEWGKALRPTVHDLVEENNATQGDIGELQQNWSALREDVGILHGQVDDMAVDIDNLQYDVNSLATDIGKLGNSIAHIEGNTASNNYAVGTYLIQSYQLYRVTQPIATGETITAGTNVTPTTVMEEIM